MYESLKLHGVIMNAKEKDLCDRMQERIEEGMMTTLEHELFVAWIEALNRIKNLEVALDDRYGESFFSDYPEPLK